MEKLTLKKKLTDSQAEALKATFLTSDCFDLLVDKSCDIYDSAGLLLAKFRTDALDCEVLKSGYEAFKGSIDWTQGRGTASGGSKYRTRDDGTESNTMVGELVQAGAVGYLDPPPAGSRNQFCRKTAFTREHFQEFKEGVPFVQAVDGLYAQLCPEHYRVQRKFADGTNRNYVIPDTAFTTVTVNRNFITAVHKDAGDLPQGFGNLVLYREGNWGGGYFCLPQYKVAFNLKNGDVLFVDVHKWHGNTPWANFSEEAGDLRIAFVLYYREGMIRCGTPTEELQKVKMDQGGFMRL